jgi:hypothetical protein
VIVLARKQYVAWRVAGLAGLAIAFIPLGRTLWLARADWVARGHTAEAIQTVIRQVPENREYYRYWAEIDGPSAVMALGKALERNRRSAPLQMELAEMAEAVGDDGLAERSLRRAVEMDQTMGPRLLLAEFYFRRSFSIRPVGATRRAERFREAARAALEIASQPPVSIFEKCWALSQDGEWIRERAIPDRPKVLERYPEFLTETRRLEAARAVAAKLMAGNVTDAEGGDALLAYCDPAA